MKEVFPVVKTKESTLHTEKRSCFWYVSQHFPYLVFAAYKGNEMSMRS